MTPLRPQGSTAFHRWAQAVHDKLFSGQRPSDAPDSLVSRTTKGSFSQPRITRATGLANPFVIYQGSDWLKAKVKTGWIVTADDVFEPGNIDTDLTLTTATEKNWIYLELTSSTATFVASVTMPTFSASKIPVGWVDTTNTSENRQEIVQLLRDHIFDPCT